MGSSASFHVMNQCLHPETTWHKVAELDDLPEGRVKTVTVGRRNLALTNVDRTYGALDNRCPHQGGPLGEGSIEKGWLRCTWHGYDYNPLDGKPPQGFSDSPPCFATEVRDDGVYVALPPLHERVRTVSDVLVETMVNWGVTHVFGMVGHSNLGFADAMREAEARGDLTYVGIRHEGAASFAASAYGKLTGELAACFGIAGPGSTNLLTGLYDAKVDRAPVLAISGQVPSKTKGRGAFQDLDLAAAFSDVARYSETVLPGGNHAEIMTLACKTALVERDVAHLMLPDEVQVIPSNHPAGGPAGRTGRREIAPPEDVLAAAAARIAEAHEFILALPKGYDTIVGERGQKLSGGQRQRLSIARALLTEAPILVLDEATSAVDNETEAAIQRSLANVANDHTLVVIAHRLSTIRHADRVYVLDKGKVVESGTRDHLIARTGIYRSLWEVQTGMAVASSE